MKITLLKIASENSIGSEAYTNSWSLDKVRVSYIWDYIGIDCKHPLMLS